MAKIDNSKPSDNKEQEFARLFKSNREMFVRIANSYVHDYSAAEDITNDTFIKLWEKHRDGENIENYQSYAFRMIVNNCLNYLKASQIRLNANQSIGDSRMRMQKYEISSLSSMNPSRIFEAEIRQIYKETVESLPEITREVFVANRYFDKTYSEIAYEYNLTVRQVTSHMQYALRALRSSLKDYITSH